MADAPHSNLLPPRDRPADAPDSTAMLLMTCSPPCFLIMCAAPQAEWGASGLPEAGPPGVGPAPLGQTARKFYCLLGHLYAAARAELGRMASALKLDLPGQASTHGSHVRPHCKHCGTPSARSGMVHDDGRQAAADKSRLAASWHSSVQEQRSWPGMHPAGRA